MFFTQRKKRSDNRSSKTRQSALRPQKEIIATSNEGGSTNYGKRADQGEKLKIDTLIKDPNEEHSTLKLTGARQPEASQFNSLEEKPAQPRESANNILTEGNVATSPDPTRIPVAESSKAKKENVQEIYERYYTQMKESLEVPKRKERPHHLTTFSSPKDQGPKQLCTFNYIGSINKSFGIIKKTVPIKDKYQSYIDKAIYNYDREKLIKQLAAESLKFNGSISHPTLKTDVPSRPVLDQARGSQPEMRNEVVQYEGSPYRSGYKQFKPKKLHRYPKVIKLSQSEQELMFHYQKVLSAKNNNYQSNLIPTTIVNLKKSHQSSRKTLDLGVNLNQNTIITLDKEPDVLQSKLSNFKIKSHNKVKASFKKMSHLKNMGSKGSSLLNEIKQGDNVNLNLNVKRLNPTGSSI